MKTISGKLLQQLGWTIKDDFPEIKKSVTIFAPHTAHIDFLYGKLGFTEIGVKYKFLSKKELFFFPMNLIMRSIGSIPVRGVKNKNAIFYVADLLKNSEELHVVISPEGWIKKVPDWNRGFYHIAKKAEVPIVVAYLDYNKKEMGVKGVIYNVTDYDTVKNQINTMYKGVYGKRPENFVLES